MAVPLGVLVAAFLWINEFPDAAADAAAGKRTLVVALGRRRALGVFAALFLAAFGLLLLLPPLGRPWAVLGGLLGAPAAWRAVATAAAAGDDSARLVPAQVATLLTFLLYALGSGAGVLLFGGA
jgi:1,4-dihydroxy-2-naphthoate octaprenyltransferase